MRTVFILLAIILIPGLISSTSMAQHINPWKQSPDLYFLGYLDIFYAYDFNQPESGIRQPFFYNHNRHNQFNLNLGILGFEISNPKYRVGLGLHTGTYPMDNYSDEPGVLKNIYEAYIGLALNKKNNLWLDAGIFESFIGFENPISINNWTLTRSLCAENVPYFLTGAKITYKLNDRWQILGSILNGWQRIQPVQGNSLPSFGTQVLFTPNKRFTFNWSTFIGTDDPDSTRRMRYFNNFYGILEISDKLGLIAGFDIGYLQESKGNSSYDNWHAVTLILRYEISEKWMLAFRGENYVDRNDVMIESDSPNGFNTSGLSLNGDFRPIPNLACRMEVRWLNSVDEIFAKDDGFTKNNLFVVASMAFKLRKQIN
ncbi:MAG: porin [Cyclobacteriaceae bacterium]